MEISNEEKAKELAHFILYDNSYESMDRNTYDKCMQMAHWKDEQHKQEKQQTIDKACKLMQHWILEHDYVDIMELEDYIKQQMEE